MTCCRVDVQLLDRGCFPGLSRGVSLLGRRTWEVNCHQFIGLVQIDDDDGQRFRGEKEDVVRGSQMEYGGWWGVLD